MKAWCRVLCCVLAIPAGGSAGIARADVGANVPLRRCWAVLVGVNYTDRTNDAAFPPLDNAAHDARAVSEHLLKYYQGYSETTVRVLTDATERDDRIPTRSNIDSAITWLEQNVRKGDSVLLFFAGHAFPSTTGGVVFLPLDYQFKKGSSELAETSAYKLRQLAEKLQALDCNQRLLILDCCYAGAVYDRITPDVLAGQEKPQSMYFDALSLEESHAFQVIVSARATQRADDGGSRRNSKFTYHLINALKFHGARRAGTSRPFVLARELVDYVRLRFDDDENQRPDCRNLYYTGDFFFRPRQVPGLFDESRMPVGEQSELLAVVASQQGHWWFEEIPWCIPGLRKRIFDEVLTRQHSKKRSGVLLAPVFSPAQMREVAREILKKADFSETEGTLQQIRMRHAKLLLDAQENGKLQDAWVQIEAELTELMERSKETRRRRASVATVGQLPIEAGLEAVDLHLLAVVRHALRQRDGKAAYERAIRAYREQGEDNGAATESGGEDSANASDGTAEIYHAIPRALCHADYGEFLQEIDRQPQQAVKQYRAAIEIVRDFVPELEQRERTGGIPQPQLVAKLFSVFVLTRTADSHLRLNHWDDANQILEKALVYVQDVAAGHYLEAHVHRRRAWAQIMQWRMSQAIRSFENSNAVLDRLFEREFQGKVDRGISLTGSSRREDGPPRWNRLSQAFVKSANHAAKLAYLHNLHGIAMARRFLGDTTRAAREYRWLSSQVEHAIATFRQTTVDPNLELYFVLRIVNTLERLGDCNLFGDPLQRQLGEAADDYRRALQYVYALRQWEKSPGLRVRTSDRWMGVLLYKRALALSLPSPIQDTKLALEMCEEADRLFAKQANTATDTWQALGRLATATVRLLDVSGQPAAQAGNPDLLPSGERPSRNVAGPRLSSLLEIWQQQPVDTRRVAAGRLRAAIVEYRDVAGMRPHRDQLEICLFASKVLLEFGGDRSRFGVAGDAELLHSFCRMALFRDTGDSHGTGERSEARAYLRPYYDALFRSRAANVAQSPVVVKELIELQREATTGRRHHKQVMLKPVLAVYILGEGGDGYLLWDEPAAPGVCVSLGEYYDVAMISRATSFNQTAGTEEDAALPIMVPAAGAENAREHGHRQAVSASGTLRTGRIPLPRRIRERMEALAAQAEGGVAVTWRPDFRLAAAVRHQPVVARVDSAIGPGSSATTTFKLIQVQDTDPGDSRNCPFRLPRGVELGWDEP